jgi:hypothetical protein
VRGVFHPPTHEATAEKPWRNAQRVSSEALALSLKLRRPTEALAEVGAKEDMLPAFVAESATTAEEARRVTPKI